MANLNIVNDKVFAALKAKILTAFMSRNAEHRRLRKHDFSDKELVILSKVNFNNFSSSMKNTGIPVDQVGIIINRIKNWAHAILNHAAMYQHYLREMNYIKEKFNDVYQRQRMVVTFTYKYSGKIERSLADMNSGEIKGMDYDFTISGKGNGRWTHHYKNPASDKMEQFMSEKKQFLSQVIKNKLYPGGVKDWKVLFGNCRWEEANDINHGFNDSDFYDVDVKEKIIPVKYPKKPQLVETLQL